MISCNSYFVCMCQSSQPVIKLLNLFFPTIISKFNIGQSNREQTYLMHTNPHINLEVPLESGGPNGLLSRLQLWPPGLIKAPLGPGVENLHIPSKFPTRDPNCQKFPPYKMAKLAKGVEKVTKSSCVFRRLIWMWRPPTAFKGYEYWP